MAISNVSTGNVIDPVWGNAVTDQLNGLQWTTFTPTFNSYTQGNASAPYGKYAMLSDNLLAIFAGFTVGSTSTVGGVSLTLPNSLSADSGIFGSVQCGWVNFNDTGTASIMGVCRIAANATALSMLCVDATATYAKLAGVSSTVPFTWTTGDHLDVVALIPVN